jgi:D-alanyl-D-alanine carboxypeptidase
MRAWDSSTRVVWLLITFSIAAPEFLAARLQAESLEERIRPLIQAHEGQVAVTVKHLEKGEGFAWRADEPMPTASLIKFPVMIEAYRQAELGNIDLAKPVTLRDEDKVPGSGILTSHFSAGASFALRDSVRLMIALSDNTATNLVLDQIGLAATAKYMEELGCPNTKIHAKVFKRETSIFPERSRQFGLGSTTAAEMLKLLELLHARKLVSAEVSEKMREHLLACDDRLKFRRLLPEGTKLAHKTGSVDDIRTDAGIIESPGGPIALCVLTRENKDTRWVDDNAGDLLCAKIARAAYHHFNPAGVQPSGCAAGRNQSSKNDFAGPRSTQADGCAVRSDRIAIGRGASFPRSAWERASRRAASYQSTQRMAFMSGNETTQSVGTSVPTQSVGTSEREGGDEDDEADSAIAIERQPRDPLTGPPFVSSRAWAVADAKTGKLLDDFQSGQAVDTASTTKIMTAYVLLKLAQSQPEILDETISFSERADNTAGSSCGIRAGEMISARELLFGLLVPSGNDAAIALAEHFGSRFEPPKRRSNENDAVARFVAEMNRMAEKLKLTETRYQNPNGLPEKGHVSSARDLVRLTCAARQFPLFRECVASRQHEAAVSSRDGARRKLVWKSTNRLLAIAGYTGVKTGYTKGAGSCLVSSGERGSDSLVVVVLGAPSAAAAVADSRNLYRWAWREKGHRE